MSSRWYPIYQRGNPQLRIFLPNFWLKLVKPVNNQPPNIVRFHAPVKMTNHDIKQYLEKIYQVPVADVRSEITEGALKRQRIKGYIVKQDDYRTAFVTLKHGDQFEFPDMFSLKAERDKTEAEKVQKEATQGLNDFMKRNRGRGSVPGWFSI